MASWAENSRVLPQLLSLPPLTPFPSGLHPRAFPGLIKEDWDRIPASLRGAWRGCRGDALGFSREWADTERKMLI